MCLPPLLVDGLRNEGHTVDHWSMLGDPRASDLEIMNWALQHDHVVLMHDMDFNTLLYATKGTKPSVVIIRSADTSPETILVPVIRVLARFEEELDQGALISMGEHIARVRRLPLV